ncbi:MAG: response regulator transcription factor [Gammaproteobacteria bacterium]|nr:response regulator transcription factor [Gammaproteobacteria bacterium]
MQDYAPLSPPYRVYVLDDHKLLAELLSHRLSTDAAIAVLGVGNSGAAARHFIGSQRADIVLLDMEIDREDGVAIARDLLAVDPRLRIVGLSAHVSSHYPLALLEAGGRGFLSKRITTRDLVENVRRVARGDLAIGSDVAYHLATDVRDAGPAQRLRGLTGKEGEVLRLLARGHSPEEIAEQLGMSVKTVQSHRSNMRRKLKLRSDVELCLLALKAGYVHVHEAK